MALSWKWGWMTHDISPLPRRRRALLFPLPALSPGMPHLCTGQLNFPLQHPSHTQSFIKLPSHVTPPNLRGTNQLSPFPRATHTSEGCQLLGSPGGQLRAGKPHAQDRKVPWAPELWDEDAHSTPHRSVPFSPK